MVNKEENTRYVITNVFDVENGTARRTNSDRDLYVVSLLILLKTLAGD